MTHRKNIMACFRRNNYGGVSHSYGWHHRGNKSQQWKFIGTYNEEYCTSLIQEHDSEHYTLDLIDFRKTWMRIKEQIDAFTEAETKKETQEKS